MIKYITAAISGLFFAACQGTTLPISPDDSLQAILADYDSFEACLISGAPIMESYPRQCAFNGKTYVEDISTGKTGDTKRILFEIGPEIVRCHGAFEQDCLIVNQELFYDSIDEFTHKPGVTTIAEIERTQYCDPDEFNSCPQDVGIYRYRLLGILSETPTPGSDL